MHAFPTLAQPLRSERVLLRYEAERDIPEVLIAHQDDPALYLRLGLLRPPSGAELGRRIEAGPDQRAAGVGVRFTIVEPGSDDCRGQSTSTRCDWEDRRAEAGIWVAPGYRGRGLAPAALRLAGRWLFDACGMERLELLTELDNAPMVAAAEVRRADPRGRSPFLRERARPPAGSQHPVAAARRPRRRPGVKGWRVTLPPGVGSPFEVYVNGVRQELGSDYRVSEGQLVFERELVSQKLGVRAWLLGFWGIGTYKRNDEVDVRYELDGRPTVAHGLKIIPPPD